MEEAPRFGIMAVDGNDDITEFQEKPKQPKSNLASMGIYIFTWSKLKEYLMADEADENSSNDFGKNIIPAMLSHGEKLTAYRFHGYWKDVGTISSLWDANMDLLASDSGMDPYDPEWPIYARSPMRPPHFSGPNAKITHSMVTGGCEVWGEVDNSVLFSSVTVEEGAHVHFSILMPGTVVKRGAVVEYAIVAENSVIGEDAKIGTPPPKHDDEGQWGIAVVAQDLTVGPGVVVPANAMVTEDLKGGAQ